MILALIFIYSLKNYQSNFISILLKFKHKTGVFGDLNMTNKKIGVFGNIDCSLLKKLILFRNKDSNIKKKVMGLCY